MAKRLLTARQIEKVKVATDAAVAQFISELPKLIHTRLEGLAAQILGFSNRWSNGWEVDNCNGRQSTLGEYVCARTRDEANKLVGKLDVTFTKKMLEGLQADFERRVKDTVHDGFYKAVQKKSEEILNEMVENVGEIDTIDLGISPEDVHNPVKGSKWASDPERGKTEVEKLILKELLAKYGMPDDSTKKKVAK